MPLAKMIDGKRYEMLRAFKYNKDAEKLADSKRKQGMSVRIIRQKQYVNLKGDEKWFYGLFAR